jgi:type VI secretion system secreted protein VgrG
MSNSLFKAEIFINTTPLPFFDSYMLRQGFNQHHYFEVKISAADLETVSPGNGFGEDLIGKPCIIYQYDLIQSPDDYSVFVGTVTGVEPIQQTGTRATCIISGYSKSIELETGPNHQCFQDKT